MALFPLNQHLKGNMWQFSDERGRGGGALPGFMVNVGGAAGH